MPRLKVLRGEAQGRVYEFEDEASIGRSTSNLVRLHGTQISRQHAQILKAGEGWIVRDCGSRNGIFVNGRAQREAPLRPGDEIQVAGTVLVFEPAGGPSDAAAPRGGVVFTDEGAPEGEVTQALDAAEVSLAREKTGADLPRLAHAYERLKKVYEIGTAVATLREPRELVERLLELVMNALEADRGFVLLKGKSSSALNPAAVRAVEGQDAEIALSRTILNRVLRHGKAIRSADAMQDPRFRGSESVQLASVRSVLCVPLTVRDRVIGALYADKTRPHHSFDDDDLKFLTTVAHQAGPAIENARVLASARDENLELRRILGRETRLVAESPAMLDVLKSVEKVGRTDSTVLIAGETGTGKELVARMIHDVSARAEGPFVAVNCAAVPEPLLESELFGHERGAFTGAHRRKKGRFETADGGTLFLDEIGELPLPLQSKLLRALEERRYERLGGTEPVDVDVRILAASNRDLGDMVRRSAFREDLFYRLAVVPLTVPPLRERPEDVEALTAHFLEEFGRTLGKQPPAFTPEALEALKGHAWPGNVRELRNLVERVVVLAEGGTAGLSDLPAGMVAGGARAVARSAAERDLPLQKVVEEVERTCIERALKLAGGKKVAAARMLGISRPTLDKKIKAYGIGGGP